MSPEIIGLICVILLLVLIYTRMWVGLAMLVIGFWGLVTIIGWNEALSVLALTPYSAVADYTVAAIPLFILMGMVVYHMGFASDLFYSANKCIGQLPGGLAMASSAACAILGVVTDSPVAVITLGKVAVPEMRKYHYDDSLANASIVAGAALASLIPPSVGFIVYGMLTGASIGELYIAAVIPGIVLTVLIMLFIGIRARINPRLAPPGPKTNFKEKIVSLKYTWGVGLIFVLILVGIYAGVFTPTEAGAIGAFGALVTSLFARRLNRQNLINSILETAQMTAMIVLLIVGAFTFIKLMAVSKLPFMLADFVIGLALPKYVVMTIIILIYIVLGMFCDIMAAIMLTIPVIFPVVVALGFDPLWYGVLIVIVAEMGLITPPIGMSVFMLSGITKTPISTIFRGVWPFVAIEIIFVAILTAFPQIALWLPSTM